MHLTLARLRSLTAVLCFATLLTACAGTSTPVGATGSSEPSPDEPPTTWQDLADPAERLAGCLVGSFTLARDAWVASIQMLASDALGDVTVQDRGVLALDLTATEYTIDARDSATVTVGNAPDGAGELRWELAFDGTESGTLSLADDLLTLSTGPEGRLAPVNTLSIGGQPLPSNVLPVDGSPWSDTLRVTCDADRLTAVPVDDPSAPVIEFERSA